jgi:hypothetical protein
MNFKAWVPCVSGRLSFRHFGESLRPYATTIAGKRWDGTTEKDLIFFQSRYIYDGLNPNKDAGKMAFLFVGKYTPGSNSPLSGSVYWFKRLDWQSGPSANVSRALGLLAARSEVFTRVERPMNLDALPDECQRSCWSSYKILLERDGELTIELPGVTTEKLKDHPEWVVQRVVDEVFFFIRDVAHSHRHHPPTSEAYIYSRRCNGTLESDLKWRVATLSTLQRAALSSRTFAGTIDAIHGKGILAYADKFRDLCKQKHPSELAIGKFDGDSLAKSINADVEARTAQGALNASYRQTVTCPPVAVPV